MNIKSSDMLSLLAKHNGLIVDRYIEPLPLEEKLKGNNFLDVENADGNKIMLETLSLKPSQLCIPREILNDFLAASFVEIDKMNSNECKISYKISLDGLNILNKNWS